MSASPPKRILFLNRSYWPDAEATGQLLTELCEDLASEFEITVLAGQPNQNPREEDYVRSGKEVRNGVTIERVKNSRFAKRSMIGKLWNFFSFLWFAFWRSFRIPRQDIVVCETDPFLLPFLAVWLRFRHRCKLVFYLQDIYPDIAVAVEKAKEGFVVGTIRRLLRWCYRRADTIVVLSEEMRATLIEWGTLNALQIHIVPNWIDCASFSDKTKDDSWRRENGIQDEFLVMYSGNLGLSQDLHIVLEAARLLKDQSHIRFLLIGDGASKPALTQNKEDWGLENVTFLPYQPRERLAESLSSADLHLLPIRDSALRCLMPSKLYGILASGSAVLSTAPPNTELAEVIREGQVGENLYPFEAEPLSARIREFASQPELLKQMGERARDLVLRKYDRPVSVAAMREVLYDLHEGNNRQTEPAGRVSDVPESVVSASPEP